MLSLADAQAEMRRALTSGDGQALGPFLVGGDCARRRFTIHQRHYEASLLTALVGKFPATAWLIGSDLLTRAARAFVKAHPPRRPCIAEYGDNFPPFLATYGSGATLPYLQAFAELEWHVAQVSIATSQPALDWSQIAHVGADALPRAQLSLQRGLRYLHAGTAVDDLMKVYLAGSAPDQFTLAGGDTWIEIRGARGEVQVTRMDLGTFLFRTVLLDGFPLEDAAGRALEHARRFDVGQALMALVAERLVTAIVVEGEGTS